MAVTWESLDEAGVEYRERVDGAWSDWAEVHVEPDQERGTSGTEPIVVVGADRVEARVSAAVPGVQVHVIDPGTSGTADAAAQSTSVADATSLVTPMTAATPTAAATPPIRSRAAWGADESIRTWVPETGRVQGADVHHTAGTNFYTAAQVPAIIRGIYHYHAITRDWGDIGYNVLVDAYGRAWEGRYGGLYRATIGAHAAGWNGEMFGISFMGNHETAPVTNAAFDIAARVLAWKADMHGFVMNTRATINGVATNRTIGHRDVAQTSCPGRYLYARLGELANRAASYQGAARNRDADRDLTGDGRDDVVLRGTNGAVSVLPSRAPGYQSPTSLGTPSAAERPLGPVDWTGDGRVDLLTVDGAGNMRLRAGTTSGGFGSSRVINTGWQANDLVTTSADWNRDGRADILARRKATGDLWLYPGNGRGGFGTPRIVGHGGWGAMSSLTVTARPGGTPTLLVVQRSNGNLYRYSATSTGAVTGRTQVGSGGWTTMRHVISVGNWNGQHGATDVLAIDSAGSLWFYPSRTNGSFYPRQLVNSGWTFNAVVASQGSDTALVTQSSSRELRRYPYQNRTAFGSPVSLGFTVPSTTRVFGGGDWDRDGRADVMRIDAQGRLYLHRGTGGSRVDTAGRLIGSGGWQGMTSVVAAGDFRGDGGASLVALERSTGYLWLYPGDGDGGFRTRLLIGTGFQYVDAIIGVGNFSGGRAPDLLVRNASSGQLQLLVGRGPGRVLNPVTISTGWGSGRDMVGVGDADGDGRDDVVGVQGNGAVHLHSGAGTGGFPLYVPVATLPAGTRAG
ncbi:N-acetylmuramoyl-L-alanine amidase family 2 [Beutenbergia cavernae DSM 12333]|uniref:N-acetylmuramoyl-L-alanine amidase family 2 n=1 Tax=Beutenbergia cavernae (strain ATCC BAA-8 / DSM 12333 / CCUG 43141 / JCM 11478 / NBRC 16432 / NCIMB 13614 / HKI 0122) TaxID=471853 RepID=C5C144_BEUC1|nr:FG-GAP-like repeat-containing protein [Beutenbergia cavernae]ACQ79448.1 N-acetylmuramoyl-L-alanine amidase family 2 [Beutenbergia cavernae DSM 12333]